jgi:hypothetical protein
VGFDAGAEAFTDVDFDDTAPECVFLADGASGDDIDTGAVLTTGTLTSGEDFTAPVDGG